MKIGIIGCGQVGSAGAFAFVLKGVGSEIVLVDRNHALAKAQAEDILHATPFAAPIPVRAGNFDDLHGAGIVMIAAGAAQKDGETRLDLLKRNAEIFETLIPQILDVAPEAILVIASNPVDVMTHMVAKIAAQSHQIPSNRIIGSGTILDTARFRALLGEYLGVSSHSVHGYVLGEHGDSEVLHWSGTNVGNMPLADFAVQVNAPMTDDVRRHIDDGVRNAAYRIIQGKGATWYGIGAGMAQIADSIINNRHALMTCCSPTMDVCGVDDITLSLPRIIAASGIETTIHTNLNEGETDALRSSAEILKSAITQIGF